METGHAKPDSWPVPTREYRDWVREKFRFFFTDHNREGNREIWLSIGFHTGYEEYFDNRIGFWYIISQIKVGWSWDCSDIPGIYYVTGFEDNESTHWLSITIWDHWYSGLTTSRVESTIFRLVAYISWLWAGDWHNM